MSSNALKGYLGHGAAGISDIELTKMDSMEEPLLSPTSVDGLCSRARRALTRASGAHPHHIISAPFSEATRGDDARASSGLDAASGGE